MSTFTEALELAKCELAAGHIKAYSVERDITGPYIMFQTFEDRWGIFWQEPDEDEYMYGCESSDLQL